MCTKSKSGRKSSSTPATKSPATGSGMAPSTSEQVRSRGRNKSGAMQNNNTIVKNVTRSRGRASASTMGVSPKPSTCNSSTLGENSGEFSTAMPMSAPSAVSSSQMDAGAGATNNQLTFEDENVDVDVEEGGRGIAACSERVLDEKTDVIIDRKRRWIGDEFYNRNGSILNQGTGEQEKPDQQLSAPINKEGNNVHLQFSFRGGNDTESPIDVDPGHEVHINEGVAIEDRDEDQLDIPEDPNGELLGRLGHHQGLDLGLPLDAQGNENLVVTSVRGALMQDVILYNGNPGLMLNGLPSGLMHPGSISPSNSSPSRESNLSPSPPLGPESLNYSEDRFNNGSGIYGSSLPPSPIIGLSHHQSHHGHQFSHHGEYGNINQLHGVVGNYGDMATLLSQSIKNEPEDLTGSRRDPRHNNNDSHDGLPSNMSGGQSLMKSVDKSGSPPVVLIPDAQVVLTSAMLLDLNNSTFGSVGSTHGLPGDHPSYTDFSGSSFDQAGRVLYSSDSYRPESDMYNPAPSPDFSSGVSRVNDVQYTPYHYKSNSGQSLGQHLPQGPGGHTSSSHLNSPDQDLGHSDSFDTYPHSDILTDNYRKWNADFRTPAEEKVQIPKIFTPYGFKYTMEAPTSGSVRREDDRITYINKGQFYGLTLEYLLDHDSPPLKSSTVKSVIMLVFREGKSPDDELKAWQFWHGRQHSVKQRIIDLDQKNSSGIVVGVEESHALNALNVFWNPMEGPAKVNIAVQCLSTDFSTQKGVKGLPLHIQIDTYDDPRDANAQVYHRAYAQIKVFCDKGAERKARDEERRASKRRTTPSGKRRLDEMYHTPLERSEFYSMVDMSKIPVLFHPSDMDKSSIEFGGEIPGFYSRGSPPDSMMKLNGSMPATPIPDQVHSPFPTRGQYPSDDSKFVGHDEIELEQHHHQQQAQHIFEPRSILMDGEFASNAITLKKEHTMGTSLSGPLPEKRAKILPSPLERIMIYVRQETEEAYTPLHLVPPSVSGLIRAIESKYKITARHIRYLYRKNKQGSLVKLDDDMLKYYCNEDVFLMQVMVTEGIGEDSLVYDITLVETQ